MASIIFKFQLKQNPCHKHFYILSIISIFIIILSSIVLLFRPVFTCFYFIYTSSDKTLKKTSAVYKYFSQRASILLFEFNVSLKCDDSTPRYISVGVS